MGRQEVEGNEAGLTCVHVHVCVYVRVRTLRPFIFIIFLFGFALQAQAAFGWCQRHDVCWLVA